MDLSVDKAPVVVRRDTEVLIVEKLVAAVTLHQCTDCSRVGDQEVVQIITAGRLPAVLWVYELSFSRFVEPDSRLVEDAKHALVLEELREAPVVKARHRSAVDDPGLDMSEIAGEIGTKRRGRRREGKSGREIKPNVLVQAYA